jgi:hypothetical protein
MPALRGSSPPKHGSGVINMQPTNALFTFEWTAQKQLRHFQWLQSTTTIPPRNKLMAGSTQLCAYGRGSITIKGLF